MPPVLPRPSLRVLLVEDNATDALVACDELAHATEVAFIVEPATRLQTALALLAGAVFDVVLLDLSLPDCDGLDTYLRLRAAAPEVPVVVLSHRADEALALQAVHAGAQDYLVKGGAEGLLVRATRYAIERAHAALALRTSELRLAGVIESAMDAIISVDARQRIVLFNAAAERMFGYAAAAIMGQGLERLLPREYRARHQGHIDTFAATGISARTMGKFGQLNALRANGEEFPIEASISKVILDGQVLFTVILRDVTEGKLARMALIAAKEVAESANVAKSQFLATMSHEIRTPLNIMKGMAYAMRGTGLAPKQEECLARIDAAGAHLLRIVSDVLDLAKIEAGKIQLEQVEINVGQIATDIVDMMRGNALLKNTHLAIEMQVAISPLLGDATRLRQALLNYLGNAIKFTASGTITVRVRAEQESERDALMRFEVHDTGIGVSAETATRLFSAFEQADNSDTRQHGGTGLGLVITKRLAELMGGSAGVESIPGGGSTFWFTALLQKLTPMPFVPAVVIPSKPAGSPGQILQRDFSGQRILLVDDDGITRRLFRMLLEALGLMVDVAEDGTVAVDRAQNQAYALVVMDMQMPKMGGLQATRHIRAMTGGKQVPIIMLTGNAFEQTRAECLEAGISDFMTKPVEPEDLFALIVKWLTVTRDQQLLACEPQQQPSRAREPTPL